MKPTSGYKCPGCGWEYVGRKEMTCPNCDTLCVQQMRGLGDWIATGIYKIDGGRIKQLWKKLTGKDCGCGSRQEKLNKLFKNP